MASQPASAAPASRPVTAPAKIARRPPRGGPRPLHLALRLARDGDAEPTLIEDTETTFAVEWTGEYRIVGSAFVYADRDTGRATTIFGYPTQNLSQTG